jgi:predicted dithiol-disulfide oxidoreductase (DUF899 family)
MINTTNAHPPVVDLETWQRARNDLLTLEKVGTRLTDAIAAQRRRLPMTEVENYTFTGKDGPFSTRQFGVVKRGDLELRYFSHEITQSPRSS